MKEKQPQNRAGTPEGIEERIRNLEEKFLYQELTVDALNDVIIEQQSQLNSLEDQIRRLQSLLTTIQDSPDGGEEPPPPHY